MSDDEGEGPGRMVRLRGQQRKPRKDQELLPVSEMAAGLTEMALQRERNEMNKMEKKVRKRDDWKEVGIMSVSRWQRKDKG